MILQDKNFLKMTFRDIKLQNLNNPLEQNPFRINTIQIMTLQNIQLSPESRSGQKQYTLYPKPVKFV